MAIEFEWDDFKALGNLRKHGIAFGTAARVFEDPFAIECIDESETYGEERWTVIGDVSGRLVHVAYTLRDDDRVVRIISARYADRREQHDYHTHFGG